MNYTIITFYQFYVNSYVNNVYFVSEIRTNTFVLMCVNNVILIEFLMKNTNHNQICLNSIYTFAGENINTDCFTLVYIQRMSKM